MLRAQFTYTKSTRAGVWDKQPGWKVQSLTAAPGVEAVSADVVRRAARNVGGFVPPPLPELASQADVDALPRCLRLDVLDGRLTCLSHIVAAGPDHSGRPNFFAHGLVLELGVDAADEHGFLRPADLWDADLWLRPLGPAAVESSEPDAGLRDLRRGPVDDAALESFTRSHPNQRSLVLAAFERYASGGGPLVVVGDAAGSVAHWHRLLGLLLTPATAWRTPFSTYERARDPSAAEGWPFALVGVPSSDAEVVRRLPGTRFVVLQDDGEPLSLGLGRWRLQDGTELVAGPWAQLAETLVVSGLLGEVAVQLDALAIECGPSTVAQPLWALGAAVLLMEDLPLDDLARDAAEIVARHWPPQLVAGRTTVERLLHRLTEHATSASDGMAQVVARSGGNPDSLVTQLALLTPVRAALASPAGFEQSGGALPATLPPLAPAVRHELDDLIGDALGWVPVAGDGAARALLRIAGLMDGEHSPAPDRTVAGDLARTLIAPLLFDRATDPGELRWPPCPAWLWTEMRPALVERLDLGQHDPGRAFSAATHRWLGDLSLPRGPLAANVLARTGPLEWERGAYRVWYERGSSPTPLERGAAFLAAVNSSAITEGRHERDWARLAAEEAYPKSTLDLATALVLMACLPAHLPFAPVLAAVLERTRPSAETAEAVARLRARDGLPATYDELFDQHERWEEHRGGADGVVAQKDQIVPVISNAQLADDGPAWTDVTETMLRLDVAALPVKGLASRVSSPDMPWEEGFAQLRERETDPEVRTLLAAHLLCRGARAGVFPGDDHATKWLVAPGSERGRLRVESAALDLLADVDDADAVVEYVERLAAAAPRKPAAAGQRTLDADNYWRVDAVVLARRTAAYASRSGRQPGRLRVGRRGSAE